MKRYLAGITLASALAYVVFKVVDDQLAITWRISNFINGRTS
jgi:hypothetical protein